MMTRWRWLLAVAGAMALASCSDQRPFEPSSRSYDGPSSALKATQVVPTLDTPIANNHNAVWCSSFLAAWKALGAEVAKADIALQGDPPTAQALNRAEDPRPHVPAKSMYVATGWKQKGVTDRIHRELKEAFPAKPAPAFPDITDDSMVAYSYLEAKVSFSLPYFQNRKPFDFTDSQGRKTPVAAFGIREEDDYSYDQLRSQPRILFRNDSANGEVDEFALDLCASSGPSQIVVARIKREPTLKAALERIARGEKEYQALLEKYPDAKQAMEQLGPNDILLAPNMFWQISHRFSELEGKPFMNPPLSGQRLDVAQQDLQFRLDRSGAELKSEAKIYCAPEPSSFTMDRPFLIYLKKRGAAMPYFAMWVDNAELLTPFSK